MNAEPQAVLICQGCGDGRELPRDEDALRDVASGCPACGGPLDIGRLVSAGVR